MKNRVKNIGHGIIMGLINMAISIVLPFVSRTIIIYTLGTEYIGLGGLFTSILSVLSLSELGVGAAITYSLYKPIAEGNVNKVNAILKLYRNLYRVIGIVIVVIAACLLPFLDYLVAGNLPQGMSLQILFIIHVINTVISYFVFGYKKVLLTANQRYDLEVNIASVALIIQYVLQIIVLLTTKNYYIYVIVFPIATILNNLISNYVIQKKYPQYRCEGNVGKEELIGLYKNVSGAFFSKLGSTIYLSVDNIVISAFLGLTILGKYGNYYYIISSITAIFAVVHNSLRPTVGNCIATESIETNWEYFKIIDFVYMMVVAICCSCCMVLFQDFERLWVGENNLLSNSIVVLLVIYLFAGRLSALLGVYQEAAGIWWHGKFIPLVAAVVNLVFNVIGVQIIGLPAILLSSIMASLFVTLPGTIWIMFKNYFTKGKYLNKYVSILLGTVIKTVVVVVVSWLSLRNMNVNSWSSLIVKAVLSVLMSLFMMIVLDIRNPLLKQTYKIIISKQKKDRVK